MIEDFLGSVDLFIRNHREWAGPIVFALAFGESLAVVSILVPATGILLGMGALVSTGVLDFWTLFIWAVPGAALGDWVSYVVGRAFDKAIAGVWPFRDQPELLERGHAFFQKWGVASVFIGRFFGPLRAVVPLVAGIMDMPKVKFQIANWTSAAVWVPAILTPGLIVGAIAPGWVNAGTIGTLILVLIAGGLIGAVIAWWRAWRNRR